MERNYTVLVNAGTLAQVARELAGESVEVIRILDQINLISIKATASQLPRINAISNVVAVELDRSIGIA